MFNNKKAQCLFYLELYLILSTINYEWIGVIFIQLFKLQFTNYKLNYTYHRLNLLQNCQNNFIFLFNSKNFNNTIQPKVLIDVSKKV